MEVVGHEIDPVEHAADAIEFDAGDEFTIPKRRTDQIRRVAAAMLLQRERVEARAQRLEQKREILLVVGTMHDAGARQRRIFPVDVDAVELFAREQSRCAVGKTLARFDPERSIRKSIGAPATDRNQNLQAWIALLECAQACEEIGVFGALQHDVAVRIDLHEREVERREFLCGDMRRIGLAGDVADELVRVRVARPRLSPVCLVAGVQRRAGYECEQHRHEQKKSAIHTSGLTMLRETALCQLFASVAATCFAASSVAATSACVCAVDTNRFSYAPGWNSTPRASIPSHQLRNIFWSAWRSASR